MIFHMKQWERKMKLGVPNSGRMCLNGGTNVDVYNNYDVDDDKNNDSEGC